MAGKHPVIVRNSARCLTCNEEIESRYRHDFVTCSCKSLSVDGGSAYLRRLSVPGAAFEETSIVVEDTSITSEED